MKFYQKISLIITLFFSLNKNIIFCQNSIANNLEAFISSPKLIKSQLCSFNGISKVNSNSIICECFNGFVKDEKIRKINSYPVNCSYFQKSRLITLSVAIIFPIGIDYFYLGHNFVGFVIFIWVIIILILNLWLLKWVLVYDRLTSVGNVDIVFEKKYMKFKYIVLIIDAITFIAYVINAILQGLGVIKDSNGFYTISDYNLDN